MTEENIKIRLLAFISYSGMGQTKFEAQCGLSRGFVNKLTDGIGVNKVMEIYRKFPNLNILWLISGEGEMLLSNENNYALKSDLTLYLEKKVLELEAKNEKLLIENAEFRVKLSEDENSKKVI